MAAQRLTALADFVRGTYYAVRDDGRIGPNDTPALRELAKQTGLPWLQQLVDKFERPLKPAPGQTWAERENYAVEVVNVKLADGTAFNDPSKALGAPEGGGKTTQSLNVVEVKEITVRLPRPATHEVKVFENPIHRKLPDGSLSAEVATHDRGKVSVSQDGETFYELKGEVGKNAVLLNSANRLSPWVKVAGGDSFRFSDNPQLPENFRASFVKVVSTQGYVDIDAVAGR